MSNTKQYGEELVGKLIKVWWPLDQMFYKGVISDFYDAPHNMHKIVYDDGDAKWVILKEEMWQTIKIGDNLDEMSITKQYDEELVGKRIKVWWPLDQMFYEGVINSFYDVPRNMHKIVYDDGQEEWLILKEEIWQTIKTSDNSNRGEGTNCLSLMASADLPPKKRGKTCTCEFKKERKRDSSSRSSGGASLSKSKGVSAKSSKSKDGSKPRSKSKDSKIDVSTPKTSKSMQETPKTTLPSKAKYTKSGGIKAKGGKKCGRN